MKKDRKTAGRIRQRRKDCVTHHPAEDYSGVYERICASHRSRLETPIARGRITTLEEWNRGKEQES